MSRDGVFGSVSVVAGVLLGDGQRVRRIDVRVCERPLLGSLDV
jgi:hypothetical protein